MASVTIESILSYLPIKDLESIRLLISSIIESKKKSENLNQKKAELSDELRNWIDGQKKKNISQMKNGYTQCGACKRYALDGDIYKLGKSNRKTCEPCADYITVFDEVYESYTNGSHINLPLDLL